jgi:hypothetical protein
MNPRDLNRAALVDFTTNAATGVASGKVTGFLAAQNTAISDALTDANAVLEAANLAAVEARSASKEATQIAVNASDEVLQQLSDLKFGMRSVESPPQDYDAIGFDPPSDVRNIVMPQTPTDLAATGFSNHTNVLNWVGNNAGGSVTYAIECKIGDTAPYVLVGLATKQSFKHIDVTPGQFYQYHVRAQAARGLVSDWSNEAVVYGLS